MAIDTSGKWWVGSEADDLREYLAVLTEDGYPATMYRFAKCECGSQVFHLQFDGDEGGAVRSCTNCNQKHFICDSEEIWSEATPMKWKCVGKCKSKSINICVGFALRDGGNDVHWIYVGIRCISCGILGCCSDWKIDYSPSMQLLDMV